MNANVLRERLEKIHPAILYTISLFVATRVFLTIVGVLARYIRPDRDLRFFTDYPWLNIWGVWDSGLYVDIANSWYPSNVGIQGNAFYAFFPLYPMLMKLLGYVVGSTYIAGLIISNACLLVACFYLYKLVRLDEDERTARRSIKYLLLFPTAFILSGVFTESLFLMLLIMCFYYAKVRNLLFVGVLGFLMTLTRSVGIVAILPLAYEYMKGIDFKVKDIKLDVLFLLLLPIGMALLMGYDFYMTGDPLQFVHAQSNWHTQFSNPVTTLFDRLASFNDLSKENLTHIFGAYFTLATIILLTAFYKRIGLSYWLLGMYTIIIPLTAGPATIDSFPRFILTIFPLFILFAGLGKDKRLDMAMTILLIVFQAGLMYFWTNQISLVV